MYLIWFDFTIFCDYLLTDRRTYGNSFSYNSWMKIKIMFRDVVYLKLNARVPSDKAVLSKNATLALGIFSIFTSEYDEIADFRV